MYRKIVLIKDTRYGAEDLTRDFYTRFLDAIHKRNLLEEVQVVRAADIGLYGQGIVLKILPDNIIYHNVQDTDIDRIIDNSINKNKVIKELFYKYEPKQLRIVLRNCGKIDPESIEDYIRDRGYEALDKVLCNLKPEQVIEEVKKSGLRGRGGAGISYLAEMDLGPELLNLPKNI